MLALFAFVAIGAGCSSGTESNQVVELKPEPVAANVDPQFKDQASVLDKYCVTRQDEWAARMRVLIAEVEEKTGKKLTQQQLFDEAAAMAPELAKDTTIERNQAGTYDCTVLLTRATWKLVPELAPQTRSQQADKKSASDETPEERTTPLPK